MEVDRPPALFPREDQDGKLLSNLEWPNNEVSRGSSTAMTYCCDLDHSMEEE